MSDLQTLKAFIRANPSSVLRPFIWADGAGLHCVILAKPSGRLGDWTEVISATAARLVTDCAAVGIDIGTAADVAAACRRVRPGT